ncbi:MAG: MBL fold metallo-hydrolase [Lachnospiraceae bacterium]|nr:MBL fold metallo-hydrolase [Lachnospiraceae bacterium]
MTTQVYLLEVFAAGIEENTYLLKVIPDGGSPYALVVDPGGEAGRILEALERLEARPEAILLTHGHMDHIGAVPALKEAYGIPVIAGAEEAGMLAEPALNMTARTGAPLSLRADREVRDGEVLTFPEITVRVIGTPGHSKGSVCYYCPEAGSLFSGDTLFRRSFGRTDLYGGDMAALRSSILVKLFTLPEETSVFPGHMEETRIGEEKDGNPIYYYR